MSTNEPPAPPAAPPPAAPPPAAPPPAGAPPPAAAPQTSGLAIASMVLGICSFVLCLGILGSIPAVIMGHIARGKIAQSGGTIGGGGMAMTGIILGYINIGLSLLYIIFVIALGVSL